MRDIMLNSYESVISVIFNAKSHYLPYLCSFARLQSHIEASMEEAIANLAAAPPKTKAKAGSKLTIVDKKRKAPKPSQGVEKLKKANTTGMAKLSNFFGKA
jgi:ribonuclease H2 subunit B